MSDFPGASYDAWKTTEPDEGAPFDGPMVAKAVEEFAERERQAGRESALDDVIEFLAMEHEHALIRRLRRVLNHPERRHVCALVNGECPDCGARE